MTKITIFVAIFGMCTTQINGAGWYAIWNRSGNTWSQKWKNSLDNVNQLSDSDKMELLGHGVTVARANQKPSAEQIEVVERSKLLLIGIPGHAEYFRDRINAERSKLEKLRTNGNEVEINSQLYKWKEAKAGFAVMAHLPSVETMRVLGEFVADDRGKLPYPASNDYDERVSWYMSWPHSYNAMFSLDALPLVSKPYKPPGGRILEENIEDAVASWKQWYQEIKDGKRTYRFEGDPTEYDLNGPAPKEKLERIAMHQRMESDREARHERNSEDAKDAGGTATNSDVSHKPVSIAALVTSCLLMAGAVGYYLLKHAKRPVP